MSGRSLVIRENSNLFIGNDNIQYVLDMMPLYMDEDDCSDLFHYGCELMVDKRPEWWRKYAEIRSKEYTDTPDEITDNLGCTSKTLLEITSEPFLLYLLAISYEDKTLDYSKRLSVNKLYNHFVSKIYHNTWNKHRRSGASAIIDEEQFYRFLMEAGLCSWQTGNRQIPIDLIEDKCRKIGFTNVLQRICSDQNIFESIAGLMLLFYIDRSSAHSEMAFEFSHKSFGEYFAGVKIARIMFELFRTTPCPLDVIAQLIEIFEHHYLDEYVTDYIIEELRIIGESDSDKLLIMQENLSALFSSLIIAPIPLNAFEGKDDKALFRSIRNVEKSVYILLCLIGTLTKKRAAPRFQSMTDFCEWINKECGFIGIFAETETVTDYSKYIMRLEFKMGICSGIYLTNHVLRDSLFDDISFEYSSMSFIQIYDCKFIKCDFAETYFSRSRFEDVVFENCTFNGSLLSAVTLSKVKFINCKFDCVFKNVTVESSEFEGNCKNIFSFNSSIDSTTLKVGETTEAMRVDKESTGFVAEII